MKKLLICRAPIFEKDFDQFQMDRGYCAIGGQEKYTPRLVREKVMSQPNAWWTVAGRSTEIVARLSSFLASWSADKVLGRNNNPLSVAKRASQLRWAHFLHEMMFLLGAGGG